VMVVVNGFVKVYDYIDYRIRVALFLTKSSWFLEYLLSSVPSIFRFCFFLLFLFYFLFYFYD
jgi:hypothetical protein